MIWDSGFQSRVDSGFSLKGEIKRVSAPNIASVYNLFVYSYFDVDNNEVDYTRSHYNTYTSWWHREQDETTDVLHFSNNKNGIDLVSITCDLEIYTKTIISWTGSSLSRAGTRLSHAGDIFMHLLFLINSVNSLIPSLIGKWVHASWMITIFQINMNFIGLSFCS